MASMMVIDKEQLGPFTWRMMLAYGQTTALPGQYLTIHCGEETIPQRPFSIINLGENVKPDTDKIIYEILFKIKGAGTRWLSERKIGDQVEVEGPKGNGFQNLQEDLYKDGETKSIILVAGGMGIAPIYALLKWISISRRFHSVHLIYGAETGGDIIIDTKSLPLPKILGSFDMSITTEDGSLGEQGYPTSVFTRSLLYAERFKTFSQTFVYACGPTLMLAKVAEDLKLYDISCQAALETIMGCGGNHRCYGDAIPRADKKGFFLLCEDGPVFDIKEVDFDVMA